MIPTTRILDLLCKVGRPTMLKEGLALDSCIATCRIALEVLRRFRIPANPIAVKLLALNAKANKFMLGGHEDWVATQKHGSYSIGMGHGQGPDSQKWDGHLVLIVQRQWLLDLSIDQASRPEHGILTEPFYTRKAFNANDVMLLRREQGTVLRYELDHENRYWKNAPDWNIGRFSSIVPIVIGAIEDSFAED